MEEDPELKTTVLNSRFSGPLSSEPGQLQISQHTRPIPYPCVFPFLIFLVLHFPFHNTDCISIAPGIACGEVSGDEAILGLAAARTVDIAASSRDGQMDHCTPDRGRKGRGLHHWLRSRQASITSFTAVAYHKVEEQGYWAIG